MKCKQPHLGFELESSCTFSTKITVTPQAPLCPLSSINSTWFALVSHQEFDGRPPLKLGACYLICCHFSQYIYIYIYIYISLHKPISNNAEFKFIKKILKKKSSPLFIEWCLYTCVFKKYWARSYIYQTLSIEC